MTELLPASDLYDLNNAGTRAALREQPAPRERVNVKAQNSRWVCFANVAKKRTGNATGWTYERAGPFYGATETAVVASRAMFIVEYMQPKALAPPRKRELPPPRDDSLSKRRTAMWTCQAEKELMHPGPRLGQWRAGPGRGHILEAERFCPVSPQISVPQEEESVLEKHLQATG
ncbi:MAG: hypothetical protein SGPRY_004716 [Prymnesium sp.]